MHGGMEGERFTSVCVGLGGVDGNMLHAGLLHAREQTKDVHTAGHGVHACSRLASTPGGTGQQVQAAAGPHSVRSAHRVTDASWLSTMNPRWHTFSFTNRTPPGLSAAAERCRKAVRSSAGAKAGEGGVG